MSAWVGAALTGASLLSGLFGQKQKSTTTSDQTTNPVYDSATQNFRDKLLSMFGSNLDNNSEFGNNYRTQGLANIKNLAPSLNNSIGDILTSRGLGRTTAGGSALTDTAYRSGHDISSFLNNLPLILDQRKQALLSGAGNFLSSLPTGTHTTSSSTTIGSTPGGFSGAVQGGSQGLATYLGQLSAQQNWAKVLKAMGSNSGIKDTGTMN